MPSLPDIPQPNLSETYQLGYYVVCVIDLLGQKDKLKGWVTLPTDGQMTPSFQKALKDTIGGVLRFNESFNNFFEASKQPTHYSAFINANMNGKDRDLYHRLKDDKLGMFQFSDTYVFYAPLATSNGELSVLPVYSILTACCMAMLLSLAAKIPLRGGIHIGTGIKIPELSFYGPALAKAHELESKEAQYPRVVVSDEVFKFVQHTPLPTGSSVNDRWIIKILNHCQEMLAIDGYDGKPFVDWLGTGHRKINGDSMDFKVLKSAYEFVGQTAEEFEKRFKTTKDPNCEKLSKRYSVLYSYLCARLPELGITISK
jgi:hypothetical protein